MGEMRNAYIWLQNLKGRDHLEDHGVDGKIVLKWYLGKCSGRVRAEFIWFRIRTSGRPL
jgi:hypothetical protein